MERVRSSAAATPRPRSAFAPTVSSGGKPSGACAGRASLGPGCPLHVQLSGSGKGVVGRRGARSARGPGRGALRGRGVGGAQQERVPGAAAAEGDSGAGPGRPRCDPLFARASGLGASAVGSVHPGAGDRDSHTAPDISARLSSLLGSVPPSRLSNYPVSQGCSLSPRVGRSLCGCWRSRAFSSRPASGSPGFDLDLARNLTGSGCLHSLHRFRH